MVYETIVLQLLVEYPLGSYDIKKAGDRQLFHRFASG